MEMAFRAETYIAILHKRKAGRLKVAATRAKDDGTSSRYGRSRSVRVKQSGVKPPHCTGSICEPAYGKLLFCRQATAFTFSGATSLQCE